MYSQIKRSNAFFKKVSTELFKSRLTYTILRNVENTGKAAFLRALRVSVVNTP